MSAPWRGRSTRIVSLPDDERAAFRERALKAAHDRYNWETQLDTLLGEYTRLTGRAW